MKNICFVMFLSIHAFGCASEEKWDKLPYSPLGAAIEHNGVGYLFMYVKQGTPTIYSPVVLIKIDEKECTPKLRLSSEGRFYELLTKEGKIIPLEFDSIYVFQCNFTNAERMKTEIEYEDYKSLSLVEKKIYEALDRRPEVSR